jgi:estrone sulfotransferase
MNPSRVRSSILHLLGFVGMRSRDVLLSSFPRSGNTWVRLLLCNLVSLCEWEGRPVDFPALDATMVELGVNNLLAPCPYSTIPRVIKTHRPYLPLFGRNRSIGIARDPRDVMVSFYHFQKYRRRAFTGSFSRFIRHRYFGLDSWFKHYTSWQDHWTLLVRYEDMLEDTTREFGRIVDLLEAGCSEGVLREAVHRSSFESVRRLENPSPSSERQAGFFRSGQTQQWLSHFSPEDIAYYARLVEEYGIHIYPANGIEPP